MTEDKKTALHHLWIQMTFDTGEMANRVLDHRILTQILRGLKAQGEHVTRACKQVEQPVWRQVRVEVEVRGA